jgi:hypothetical protein
MRAIRLLLVCALISGVCVSALPASAARSERIGAPVTVGKQGNEPNMLVAPDGTLYISALQYLYVSRDNGATWKESPGSIYSTNYNQGGLQVASDSSISIDPKGRLYFTFDYPYAGTTAVCTSDDRAKTFSCDPAAVPGGTDRMWVVSPNTKNAYLVTNEGLYQTLLFKSTDRGATWMLNQTTSKGANSNTGDLIESPKSHLIYQPFTDNATNQTATNNYDSGPLGFHIFDPSGMVASSEVTTPLSAGAALPSAGFTSDGTLYLVSDMTSHRDEAGKPRGVDVVVARSNDGGKRWSKFPPIPGTTTGTSTFTAIATGVPGHVGVLYYETPAGADANSVPAQAMWDVKWAESFNANSAHPTWRVQTVETNVHRGPMCSTAGCTGDARFAGDFVAAAFDSKGQPHLTWVSEPIGSGPVVRYAGAAR